MKENELVATIATQAGMTEKDAAIVIDTVFESIEKAMAKVIKFKSSGLVHRHP